MTFYNPLLSVIALSSAAMMAMSPAAAAEVGAGAGTPGYAVSPIALGPGDPYTGAAFGVVVDPSTDTIYAIRSGDQELSVIDGSTGIVTASIPLGIYPAYSGVVVDPSASMIYVAGTVIGSATGASVVKAIDGATKTVVATIPLPNGSLPGGMAVRPASHTLYVTEETQGSVAVIDGATNKLTTSVSLGTGTWPEAAAIDASTGNVYILDENTDALSVVDGATDILIHTISMPAGNLCCLAADASADAILVDSDSAGGGVIRVDASTRMITGVLPPGATSDAAVQGLTADPVTGDVYATAPVPGTARGRTFVINGSATKVVATINAGGVAVAADPATRTEYVASGSSGPGLYAITRGVSPVITSPASATFKAGHHGTFAVAVTGTPDPVFSETGKLPRGVSFSAGGRLSGTPAASTAGPYRIKISASNTVDPAATQAFTLYVDHSPSIISATHATFRVGHKGSFTIRTSGYPTASVRKTGKLPAGVIFAAHRDGSATLSGTPKKAARGKRYVLHVTARNSMGTAAQRFVLTIK